MRPLVAGPAAVLGGALWAAKSGLVLATGRQPPLLFEVAPVFLAVPLLHLAGTRAQRGLALAALILAVVAAAGFALGQEAWAGPLLGVQALLALAVLAWEGWALRREEPLAIAIAAATIPLVLVGGALSLLDERLLEVPLLVLAGLWAALGVRLARGETLLPSRAVGDA